MEWSQPEIRRSDSYGMPADKLDFYSFVIKIRLENFFQIIFYELFQDSIF